jgi:hypothetical protein
MALRLKRCEILPATFAGEFRDANPDYFEVYDLTGDYYAQLGCWDLAEVEFEHALEKVVPRWKEKEQIIKKFVIAREKQKK